MDIRCPVCGEPWEFDCIHEEVEVRHPSRPWDTGEKYSQVAYDVYYKPVLEDFRMTGCEALGESHNTSPNKDVAQLTSMLFDIMGDDVDGIMSELDDAEYLGLI